MKDDFNDPPTDDELGFEPVVSVTGAEPDSRPRVTGARRRGSLRRRLTAGAILVLALERGADPAFYERGLDAAGQTALIRSGPTSGESSDANDYWQRRRRNDPDLWVIELDIADAERFAAETITVD